MEARNAHKVARPAHGGADEAAETAIKNEDIARVQTALQQLSPRDRNALGVEVGVTRVREAAEAAGTTEAAFNMLMTRARKKLVMALHSSKNESTPER